MRKAEWERGEDDSDCHVDNSPHACKNDFRLNDETAAEDMQTIADCLSALAGPPTVFVGDESA